MRLLALAVLAVALRASSLNTSATATITYVFCPDRANPASCTPGSVTDTKTGMSSLNFSLTAPPIIGAETTSATYGALFLNVLFQHWHHQSRAQQRGQ